MCLTHCDPMDCSLQGPSVHGISQARILEWVAIYFSNACLHAKSLQSCPTLCNPIDSSPLGSSVPGILQARTLEWVAISFSGLRQTGLQRIMKPLDWVTLFSHLPEALSALVPNTPSVPPTTLIINWSWFLALKFALRMETSPDMLGLAYLLA